MRRSPALFAILVGGLIAGLFDICYATGFSYFFRGVSPMTILQSVASGLLGSAAYKGGAPIAALGLLLHFCIALSAAAIFYLVSRQIPLLTRRAIISGLLYGAVIFAVMYFVVIPLSAFPTKVKFTAESLVRNLAVHMIFIGLPIALAARYALSQRPFQRTPSQT